MKKIIMTIAAVSALGIAAPAVAQNRGANFDNRIENLRDQIQRGVHRGTISRHEAQPLRERLQRLNRLERRYSYGGFSRYERNDLWQRIQRLRQQIQYAERSRGGYDRRDHDDDRGRGYRDHDRDDRRGDDRRDGRRDD
jgi:hypothetical protein